MFQTPHRRQRREGFTLLEILCVLGIVALVAAFAAPALSAIKGNDVSQAVYSVSDTLEQARAYAMSKNTYVYLGVAQDSTTPTGSLLIGVVASSDGTQIFPSGNASPAQTTTGYIQISQLLRVDNVHPASLPDGGSGTSIQRPTVPESYKLGDASFEQGVPAYSFTVGPATFTSQPGTTMAPGVTSEGMLQIDPQGVVSEVGGTPVQFLEIGLKAVNGNQSNDAAIQIAGLSGAVRIYRP